jgi:hypothetical protein
VPPGPNDAGRGYQEERQRAYLCRPVSAESQHSWVWPAYEYTLTIIQLGDGRRAVRSFRKLFLRLWKCALSPVAQSVSTSPTPTFARLAGYLPTRNPVVGLEQIKSFLEEGLPLLGTTPVQEEAAERTEEPIPNLRFRRRLPKSRSAIHVFMVFRTALWVLRAGVQLIDERMSVR